MHDRLAAQMNIPLGVCHLHTPASLSHLASVPWSGQNAHGRWLRRPATGSLAVFHNLCRKREVCTRATVRRPLAAQRMPACLWWVRARGEGRERPVLSGPQRPPRGVEVWPTSVLGTACVSVFSVCLQGHLYANVKQAIGAC